MMMKFEQIAVKTSVEFGLQEQFAIEGSEWFTDMVEAKGVLTRTHGFSYETIHNVAELRFNYDVFPGKEFELLCYRSGNNFLQSTGAGSVSHFGFHVDSIDAWREDLAMKGYELIQEVVTISHKNVPDDRHYHYAIYKHRNAKFHWKLIQRLDLPDWDIARARMNGRYCRDIF